MFFPSAERTAARSSELLLSGYKSSRHHCEYEQRPVLVLTARAVSDEQMQRVDLSKLLMLDKRENSGTEVAVQLAELLTQMQHS